ncbi:MAG: MFS transporter [Clostridia bacterium]|nr:MFS transporter [Clostridia bacterium]
MSKHIHKKTPVVSMFTKIIYGSGDLGYGICITTITSFMMFFGNSVCGIPGTLMGLCMAISTCWDAVTDPICGYYSDKLRHRFWGKRHGFLVIAFIGLAVFNLLFWSVPRDWSVVAKFFWLLICLLFIDTFGTFYATPNAALGTELSSDYAERTTIQSVKSIFYLIGTLLPTILMAVLQAGTPEFPDGRYNPDSYMNMAYIGSAICMITGFLCVTGSYSYVPRLKAKARQDKEKGNRSLKEIFSGFFSTFKTPIYRTLILGYSVTMASSAFLTSAGLYVLTFTFKIPTVEMYVLLATLFLMTIFSQPLWIWMVKRFDKRTAIITGMTMTILGMVYMMILFLIRDTISVDTMTMYIAPAIILAGGGMGALYSLPHSMMGDAAAIEKSRTNEEKTGTYTGFMTFANKLGQAFTSLVVGTLIDVIGFRQGSTVQTPEVEWGLGWIVILGTLIPLIGGIIFYSRYNIKKSDIPEQEVVAIEDTVDEGRRSRIIAGDQADWKDV